MDVCIMLWLHCCGEEGIDVHHSKIVSSNSREDTILHFHCVLTFLLNIGKLLQQFFFRKKQSIISAFTNNLHCMWRKFFKEANDG